MTQVVQSIAVIGGTGQLGAAIARRLAKAGKSIIIGSRDPVKAEAAARQLGAELGCEVAFGGNVAAADAAEVVILTVPFASQRTTLEYIRISVSGKIVIDTTVPFFFNDTAPTEIYTGGGTLSLHDALPISSPSSGS